MFPALRFFIFSWNKEKNSKLRKETGKEYHTTERTVIIAVHLPASNQVSWWS